MNELRPAGWKMLAFSGLSYSSDLSIDRLKKKIEDLFEQKALRLSGKLTSEKEFSVYDNLNVIGWSIPNLRRKSAYLRGELTQKEGGTRVRLKSKPNAILPIFATFASVAGIIILFMALSSINVDTFLFIIGLVFIVLGTVYYPLSIFFRNRLRNRIVENLGLIQD